MKRCAKCKQTLPLASFALDKQKPLGRDTRCRACKSKERKACRHKPHLRFAASKSSARTRGITWTIPYQNFLLLIELPCTYCGLPLSSTGSGLDRLDNDGQYVIENVVPCCPECNRARGPYFTVEEMKYIIGPAIREAKLARKQQQDNGNHYNVPRRQKPGKAPLRIPELEPEPPDDWLFPTGD